MAIFHRVLKLGAGVLKLGSIVALSGGPVDAADQLLLGKKLLVKNPPSGAAANRVVHIGKDPAVAVSPAGGAGDPQCSGAGGGGTSSLRVATSGEAGDVTIPLPCGGWTTNAANSLYRYRDPAGTTCKLVLVKDGVLVKAVCKGAQVAVDVGTGMAPVAVVTTLNAERYCTEFGGTVVKDGSDGTTFLRKDAPAPGGCPGVIGSTSSTSTSSTSTSTTSTATSSTTTTTGPVVPCGSSAFPTCGGTCPAGQVCQSFVEAGGGVCPDIDLYCDCVSLATPCTTVSGCSSESLIPGWCPFGETCQFGFCQPLAGGLLCLRECISNDP